MPYAGAGRAAAGIVNMRPLAAFFTVLAAAAPVAAEPTPGGVPDIRHEPVQPEPGVPVLVTARLPPGTTKATIKRQAVPPGKYTARSDPAYETDWADLPMRDDGRDGDAKAGDGVFSVRVPAKYQRH